MYNARPLRTVTEFDDTFFHPHARMSSALLYFSPRAPPTTEPPRRPETRPFTRATARIDAAKLMDPLPVCFHSPLWPVQWFIWPIFINKSAAIRRSYTTGVVRQLRRQFCALSAGCWSPGECRELHARRDGVNHVILGAAAKRRSAGFHRRQSWFYHHALRLHLATRRGWSGKHCECIPLLG